MYFLMEIHSLKVSVLFPILNNVPPLDIFSSPEEQADTDSVGGLSGNKSPEGGSEALRGKGLLFFSALFFASCKILQPLQEEEKGWGMGKFTFINIFFAF